MKNSKRLLSVLIVFTLLLIVSVTAAGADDSENGSEDNPWIIESWEDLSSKVMEVEGIFRINNEIAGGEESELIIPGGADVTLDLNGHSFSCDRICIGGYDEPDGQYASLNIVSSHEGGTLEAMAINTYGDLSFSNCTATITGWINGIGQDFTLDGASVTCQGTESDLSFSWFGTKISLTGESTLDIGEMTLYVSGSTAIDLGCGCAIRNIYFISVESDAPEEYVSVVEKYADAAGYGLKFDSDTNGLYFTDENEEMLLAGELVSDVVEEPEVFKVTFKNDDDTVLQSFEVKSGETPEYTGNTPTKAADAKYTYTFSGWTPEITAVTGDVVYTAVYSETLRKYTVIFVDEDETVLQVGNVEYGATPKYTGATPVKVADAEHTYEFYGWEPEIAVVTGDATYKAVYQEKAKGVAGIVTVADNVYDGNAKSVSVTVQGIELAADNYDVTIKDVSGNEVSELRNAGTYTVNIRLKGEYTGTVSADISIEKCTPEYQPPTGVIDGTQEESEQEQALGRPKGIDGHDLSGNWTWVNVEDLGAGRKKKEVTFTPDDHNYAEIRAEVIVSLWGMVVSIQGQNEEPIINYVEKNGTTCAAVTENNIIFVREESDGISTWYGLDNRNGTVDKGSKFQVRKLSSTEDSADWQEYYNRLDDDQKERIDNNKLLLFLVDVTNPDGEKCTRLDEPMSLYIQLEDDWNAEDICAVFVDSSSDETLIIEIINDYLLPDGNRGRVGKVTLKHFSPYAIMQIKASKTPGKTDQETNKTDQETNKTNQETNKTNQEKSPATGDVGDILIWGLLAVLSCGVMGIAGIHERKNKARA